MNKEINNIHIPKKEVNEKVGLVIKSEKGPINEPIIFKNFTKAMEYFKNNP